MTRVYHRVREYESVWSMIRVCGT